MFYKIELADYQIFPDLYQKLPDYFQIIHKKFPLNLSGKHELILMKPWFENIFFSEVQTITKYIIFN